MEKCKGAMLGTAIGDALGWPYELRSKNRSKSKKANSYFAEWTRGCSNPRYHNEKILPGEYSDDTQMTLAVARSIIVGNWEKFLAENELPFWLKYERGGGGALLKAAKSCEKGVLLWQSNDTRDYFNAGGNGAVMRILPHVISAANTPDISRVMLDVIRDTLITHGHPRAFLGATCYAYALDYLLRKETVLEYGELVSAVFAGQQDWGAFLNQELFENWISVANQYCGYDFTREWDVVYTNMLRQLEFIKSLLKKGLMLDDTSMLNKLECFSKANGAGDVAALAAIYLASKYANNPALGIKVPAFSFGADTDTIASITGGLLGMLNGTNWIPPEWKAVQDYECLVQITELLLSDNKKEAAKAVTTEARAQDNGWRSSPIGRILPTDTLEVPNGKSGVVIITKWKTVLGQSIYTKDVQQIERKRQICQSESQIQLQLENIRTAETPELTRQTSAQMSMIIPSQQSASQERTRQFIMNSNEITSLAGDPLLQRITFSKALQIANEIFTGNESSETIAKQMEVEQAVVASIMKFVK
jgi:ADP-ribosylglycohydrolase